MNEKIAEIKIDLYQQGMLVRCDDIEKEALCLDGNTLMDFINNVVMLTDPDVMFELTDKGREYLEQFLKEEGDEK